MEVDLPAENVMPNFGSTRESSNFEDHTGWLDRWIMQNFNNLMMNSKNANGDPVAYRDDDARNPNTAPPLIRPIDPNYKGPLSPSWYYGGNRKGDPNFDTTTEEDTMLRKGMTPRDILLLRSYKNLPSMVGK